MAERMDLGRFISSALLCAIGTYLSTFIAEARHRPPSVSCKLRLKRRRCGWWSWESKVSDAWVAILGWTVGCGGVGVFAVGRCERCLLPLDNKSFCCKRSLVPLPA